VGGARARGLAAGACLAAACALPAPRPTPDAEPPLAAAFVAAHADPAGPAPALSPLHRAELARRGAGAAERDPLWAEAAPRLAFAYVGVLTDAGGFGHALYTARPLRPGAEGPTTVWRLDLDPRGRVVWGEPVRLLEGTAVRTVRADDPAAAGLGSLPLPPRWAGLVPGGVLGVRTADGAGYHAVGLHRRPGGSPDAFLFVIADARGGLSRDPWSFGQPVPLADTSGGRALARPFLPDEPGLAAEDRALLRAYLGTLP
jgi:hypothetical protein